METCEKETRRRFVARLGNRNSRRSHTGTMTSSTGRPIAGHRTPPTARPVTVGFFFFRLKRRPDLNAVASSSSSSSSTRPRSGTPDPTCQENNSVTKKNSVNSPQIQSHSSEIATRPLSVNGSCSQISNLKLDKKKIQEKSFPTGQPTVPVQVLINEKKNSVKPGNTIVDVRGIPRTKRAIVITIMMIMIIRMIKMIKKRAKKRKEKIKQQKREGPPVSQRRSSSM